MLTIVDSFLNLICYVVPIIIIYINIEIIFCKLVIVFHRCRTFELDGRYNISATILCHLLLDCVCRLSISH